MTHAQQVPQWRSRFLEAVADRLLADDSCDVTQTTAVLDAVNLVLRRIGVCA